MNLFYLYLRDNYLLKTMYIIYNLLRGVIIIETKKNRNFLLNDYKQLGVFINIYKSIFYKKI